jgi:hypothetical protein
MPRRISERDLLKQNIKEFLKTVLQPVVDRARNICKGENLDIVKITLTIPVQWKLEYEDFYREPMMELFGWERGRAKTNLFFQTELEAGGKQVLRQHLKRIKDEHGAQEFSSTLIADFGGHAFVSLTSTPSALAQPYSLTSGLSPELLHLRDRTRQELPGAQSVLEGGQARCLDIGPLSLSSSVI